MKPIKLSADDPSDKKKCLIVYHFFAHYRLHIMRELMQDPDWEFEMLSDSKTVGGIKGINAELAKQSLAAGGLRWGFVKNFFIFGRRFPLLWQKGLLKRLSRDDYDAVIFLGSIYFISTWVGVFKTQSMGKQVLFWTHGFLGKDGGLLSRIRHAFYRRADCCLLYGERAKKIMQDSGLYRSEKLKVIYNSLDYEPMERRRLAMKHEARSELRHSLFGNDSDPIVVAVGRVNQLKRLDLLLRALALLKDEKVVFRCLIVGDGSELESLKALALELKVESHVLFYGAAYGEDADGLLLASDICVIPGDIGLSAMHAMSAGLPAISHNNLARQMPEHEAIVDGETGSLYEYESVPDLAKCIQSWISNPGRIEVARQACLNKVGTQYNMHYQVQMIKEALAGSKYECQDN
jgi:glycosyltransferase involved in cell wall biosynthesis